MKKEIITIESIVILFLISAVFEWYIFIIRRWIFISYGPYNTGRDDSSYTLPKSAMYPSYELLVSGITIVPMRG